MMNLYRQINTILIEKMEEYTPEKMRSIVTPLKTEAKAVAFLKWLSQKDKITEEEAIEKALELFHQED